MSSELSPTLEPALPAGDFVIKPKSRRRKIAVPESAAAISPEVIDEVPSLESPEAPVKIPKPRGRPRKVVEVEVSAPLFETAAEPSDKSASQEKAETAPTALAAPRTRGRRKAVPTIAPEEVASPEVQASEVDSESESEEAKPVAESAPARTVRVRREAREHVFSHQGSLLNPLVALLEHFRANPGGLNVREIVNDLDEHLLERLDGKRGLEEALEQLSKLGHLTVIRRGTYQASKELKPIVGRLQVRLDGSGWLTPETPGQREMEIPRESLLFAWHQDRVVAREVRRNGHSIGEVIRVLERAQTNLTGTLEFKRGYAMLRADEAVLPLVVLTETMGAATGARVVTALQYPEDTGEDETFAKVTRVLGDAGALEAEREALIERFKLPSAFSSEALKEAEKLGFITAKDLKGRIDLRSKRVLILPGKQVALQIEPLGNGNILFALHVIDVAHWIDEGTHLERAMFERGISIDLRGETLPLLPPELITRLEFASNQDRLAISTLIECSSDGGMVNYVVRPSVVSAAGSISSATSSEQELLLRISDSISGVLNLAHRLAAATIVGLDATALYRTPDETSAELSSAIERASGFDPESTAISLLRERFTKLGHLSAVTGNADSSEGFSTAQPLTRAADFINLQVLALCATKLSQRRREELETQLPARAEQLERLERRAQKVERSLQQFQAIQTLQSGQMARGIVISISPQALELALENGAVGTLRPEDVGEEITENQYQWKTRLGRVFKPGSIVRVSIGEVNAATRDVRLSLHHKESNMTKVNRRRGNAKAAPRTTTPRRNVVVLSNKPRGEYARPVRVTARKLYFGEWNRERFESEHGPDDGFENRNSNQQRHSNHQEQRPAQARGSQHHAPRGQQARPQQNGPRQPQAQQPARAGQPGQNQGPRQPHQGQPRQPNPNHAPRQDAQARGQGQRPRPAHNPNAAQRPALERNANRAQSGPMEGRSSPAAITVNASENTAPRRPKRRPNRPKPTPPTE
jgi:exoribonuclease R